MRTIRWLAASVLTMACSAVLAVTPSDEPSVFESSRELTAEHPVDRLVLARLRQLRIQPSRVCSDAVFVRRVHLDLIGTLPTADEAQLFIVDPTPDKRAELIDRLLARDEFADYQAMKWCDVLRVKSEFPINLWPNAVQAYHRWIRQCVQGNVAYDKFARALLTSSGSNFRVPQVNFYRAVQTKEPAGLAQAAALTFMGTRLDRWPQSKRDDLAVFFSQVGYKPTREWKEEIVFHDSLKATNSPANAVFPDGKRARLTDDQDPRDLFAQWLITPQNPWFSRAIVNRVWAWSFGTGIIQEADDIRADNPPSHPDLIAHLEREFVRAGYDMKKLYRYIMTSGTYQLSSIPRGAHPAAARHFASYQVRRLEAEVLIDALNQITGSTESYSSPIPEPFTFVPETQRSIALADASVNSSFLELFGRSPRDTGLASERNNRFTASQSLHLLNSSHVRKKLADGPALRAIVQANKPLSQTGTALYLAILSRYPTSEELATIQTHAAAQNVNARMAAADLAWALINSPEFLHRH